MNEITVSEDEAKASSKENRTRTVYLCRFDDGMEYTVPELNELFNVSAGTICAKLKKEKPVREVLGLESGQQSPEAVQEAISPNSIHFNHTIDGQMKTLREWLTQYGVSIQTYRQRRKTGLSPEEAIKKPVRGFKDNETPRSFRNAKILCEEFGIASGWVTDIMRREGMTADEAVNLAINHGVHPDAFIINGDKLKRTREEAEMSTCDLAEKARLLSGLPFTGKMIYAAEAGRRRLCASEIIVLCDILKASPESIMSFRDILEQLSKREDEIS